MITGSSTLIQVFQLYQNKIKEKEHKTGDTICINITICQQLIVNPITMQLIN